MRVLGLRTFGKIHKVELLSVPIPTLTGSHDILIKVAYISLNQADTIRARGFSRLVENITLPFIIGTDYAGSVVEVGEDVKGFKKGERVYGFTFAGGTAAEYILLSPSLGNGKFAIAKIPERLTFAQAAALPASGATAICALQIADKEVEGGLKGKTVLVPGGLGGVGSLAVQFAKSVFGVERVITTLSTAKIPKLEGLVGEGCVDIILDYTKTNVVEEIGREKVDLVIDTAMVGFSYLPIIKSGGVLVSLFGKTWTQMKVDWPLSPRWVGVIMDFVDGVQRWRAGRWGVRYFATFSEFKGENWDLIERMVEEGRLRVVVGEEVEMGDVDGVRRLLDVVTSGKGSVGNGIRRERKKMSFSVRLELANREDYASYFLPHTPVTERLFVDTSCWCAFKHDST
ncbi:chaperonin 10-like protein [Tricladium varicosporioides]|nr:chaperonin 10-like protein [Hymenoscyphus varicosporioides]